MGQKDKILDDVKQAEAKRDGLKIEDYQKKATEKYAADKDAEKGVVNNAYDTAKVNAQATHDKAVNDTNIEYESQYERNAVQKLINEKQVAEKMANLGLTDGGLNRTQQTAVQLSYANQKGKLDLAKRSALDGLSLNLTSALREIETNRNIDLFEVDQKWKDRAYSEAQTNYNNDVANYNSQIASGYEQYGKIAEAEIEAEAKTRNAAIEASGKAKENENNKILWYYTGTYDEDDNPIFRNSEGKTQAFGAGTNPYTGTVHKDAKDKNGKYDSSKVFSNGYQPNNINGTPVEHAKNKNGLDIYTNKTGKNQAVWKANGRYYLWRGDLGQYQEVDASDLDI